MSSSCFTSYPEVSASGNEIAEKGGDLEEEGLLVTTWTVVRLSISNRFGHLLNRLLGVRV